MRSRNGNKYIKMSKKNCFSHLASIVYVAPTYKNQYVKKEERSRKGNTARSDEKICVQIGSHRRSEKFHAKTSRQTERRNALRMNELKKNTVMVWDRVGRTLFKEQCFWDQQGSSEEALKAAYILRPNDGTEISGMDIPAV